MKIGILNFAGHLNHGANLTAYALQLILNKWGHKAENMHLHCNPAKRKYDVFTRFADERITISHQCAAGVSDMQKFNDEYDTFIVGSDQVWREASSSDSIWHWKTANHACYHLAFAAPGKRRIAVAASFGNEKYAPAEPIRQSLIRELKRFSAISVRERSASDIVQSLVGIEPQQLVDPVFYIEPIEWKTLCEPASQTKKKRKMIAYSSFYHDELMNNILRDFKNEFEIINLLSCDTYTWLTTIKNADFVISDSFHVTCFSLIFSTPFACFLPQGEGEARFISLQQLMEYEPSRNITPSQTENISTKIRVLMQEPMNYPLIHANMQKHRDIAHNWLKLALTAPVPQWSGPPYRKATRAQQNQELRNNNAAYKYHIAQRKLCIVRFLLAISPIARTFLKRKKARYDDILANMAW